jgi:predicted metal-dependent hydrolase
MAPEQPRGRAQAPQLRSVIPYSIRRSSRAKRVRVTVHPDATVEVVLPVRSSERAAATAVEELRPWIERRLRSLSRATDELRRTPGTVPYLGTELRLVPEAGRSRVRRRGDDLLVPEGDPMPALERWYRAQARREVAPRLDAACERAGTAYTRLTIRGQRTRWASCSSSGAMSFNWRLLLAPAAVLDYVVEHEVCHLQVMDHSPRFWGLLEARMPDWRVYARWLRRYGSALTLDADSPTARRNAA